MFQRSFIQMPILMLVLSLGASAAWADGNGSSADAGEPGSREILRFETPGEVPLLHPSYRTVPEIEVLMTDDRITPRRAVLKPGETVVWRSLARQASQIVFEREVARSMVCHSLVNFEIQGDALRSAPLRTGDSASFCRLSPGTYRYRVTRNGPADLPSPGAIQLSSRLEGVIVVQPGPEAVAAR